MPARMRSILGLPILEKGMAMKEKSLAHPGRVVELRPDHAIDCLMLTMPWPPVPMMATLTFALGATKPAPPRT